MPQTVTSTLYSGGTYRSKAAGVVSCNANQTSSLDVITINHMLGTCPDEFRVVLRSVVSSASGGVPTLALQTINASQAVFNSPALMGGAGASVSIYDVLAEVTTTPVR